MGQIMRFRTALESVESHVHVSIPLVYKLVGHSINFLSDHHHSKRFSRNSQVVKSAIYLYFALTLIGAQTIGQPGEMYDMYFPLFTLFKLVLFIGWLKVAQSIEKPFGEDDADFQMSSLLTRHIRVRQRSPVVKLALIRALNLQPSFRLQVSFSTNSTIFQARSTWSSTLQRRMTKTMTRGNLLLTKKRLSPPKIP